jgi:hypothetical protein
MFTSESCEITSVYCQHTPTPPKPYCGMAWIVCILLWIYRQRFCTVAQHVTFWLLHNKWLHWMHQWIILFTLWHVDPLLGNDLLNVPATNTQQTTVQTHFYATPAIHARNNTTDVARGVFYVGSHTCISTAAQRMFSVLWSDPRLYNEKTTITDSSTLLWRRGRIPPPWPCET